MIRIVYGVAFDRFPRLQFIIGHMGEGLPFFFNRLNIIPMTTTKLKRPINSYLKENVHYIFSGMNYIPINVLRRLSLPIDGGNQISSQVYRQDAHHAGNAERHCEVSHCLDREFSLTYVKFSREDKRYETVVP
jgi:hypothetical protein